MHKISTLTPRFSRQADESSNRSAKIDVRFFVHKPHVFQATSMRPLNGVAHVRASGKWVGAIAP